MLGTRASGLRNVFSVCLIVVALSPILASAGQDAGELLCSGTHSYLDGRTCTLGGQCPVEWSGTLEVSWTPAILTIGRSDGVGPEYLGGEFRLSGLASGLYPMSGISDEVIVVHHARALHSGHAGTKAAGTRVDDTWDIGIDRTVGEITVLRMHADGKPDRYSFRGQCRPAKLF